MAVATVSLDNPPANSYDLEVMRRFAADVDAAIASVDGAREYAVVEQLFRSHDANEGLHAFAEKRKPEFVGA